jgi:hypothetical protein
VPGPRIAPDLIINLAELPGPRHGREAWREGFEIMRRRFPGLQAHTEDIAAAGDKVAVRQAGPGSGPRRRPGQRVAAAAAAGGRSLMGWVPVAHRYCTA